MFRVFFFFFLIYYIGYREGKIRRYDNIYKVDLVEENNERVKVVDVWKTTVEGFGNANEENGKRE